MRAPPAGSTPAVRRARNHYLNKNGDTVKKNRISCESLLRRLIAAAWIASSMLTLPEAAYGQIREPSSWAMGNITICDWR
jgi:hypothetical protein